jgi:hypothetical protein
MRILAQTEAYERHAGRNSSGLDRHAGRKLFVCQAGRNSRVHCICIFYLTEQHSKFLLHTLQVLYMCTVCDSTNINMIIELVPNYL